MGREEKVMKVSYLIKDDDGDFIETSVTCAFVTFPGPGNLIECCREDSSTMCLISTDRALFIEP